MHYANDVYYLWPIHYNLSILPVSNLQGLHLLGKLKISATHTPFHLLRLMHFSLLVHEIQYNYQQSLIVNNLAWTTSCCMKILEALIIVAVQMMAGLQYFQGVLEVFLTISIEIIKSRKS